MYVWGECHILLGFYLEFDASSWLVLMNYGYTGKESKLRLGTSGVWFLILILILILNFDFEFFFGCRVRWQLNLFQKFEEREEKWRNATKATKRSGLP